MDSKDQEKQERLLAALDRGMVMIHLDARRPGVRVPQSVGEESHLRLNLSYRFDPPDLAVTEWGVRATLSFSGRRFTVAVPWSALFAITSHASKEFWLYPDDMPPELLQQAMVPEGKDEAEPGPQARPRPALRELDGEKSGTEEGPSTPRARGHLRLIK
jgi:stringent starvation protein B